MSDSDQNLQKITKIKTFLLKSVVYSASIKKKRNAHHAKTQEVVQKYYAMNILNLPSFSACLSFEVDKSQKVSKNDLTKKEKQKRKEMKYAEKVSFFFLRMNVLGNLHFSQRFFRTKVVNSTARCQPFLAYLIVISNSF